ncbi:hypothetical protein KUTeg_018413, partial [Tegillarca granosa]
PNYFDNVRCLESQNSKSREKNDIFHNWTNEAMARAIHEESCQNVLCPTVNSHDRISGRVEENAKWGGAPVLTADDELQMVEIAKQQASLGIGFTKYIFLRCASELAISRGISFKKGVFHHFTHLQLQKRNLPHQSFVRGTKINIFHLKLPILRPEAL